MHTLTKVITLSDEAYSRLKGLKKENSFSDVVLELTDKKPKRSLAEMAGATS